MNFERWSPHPFQSDKASLSDVALTASHSALPAPPNPAPTRAADRKSQHLAASTAAMRLTDRFLRFASTPDKILAFSLHLRQCPSIGLPDWLRQHPPPFHEGPRARRDNQEVARFQKEPSGSFCFFSAVVVSESSIRKFRFLSVQHLGDYQVETHFAGDRDPPVRVEGIGGDDKQLAY